MNKFVFTAAGLAALGALAAIPALAQTASPLPGVATTPLPSASVPLSTAPPAPGAATNPPAPIAPAPLGTPLP